MVYSPYMSTMRGEKRLVFDIETAGVNFETLDPVSQHYMLQYAENDDEKQDIKERLGFYPLTGSVVAIGVINPDSGQGAVFAQRPSQSPDVQYPSELEEGIALRVGDEQQLLQWFWEAAQQYDHFISFNGRSFDVPFLVTRSAIHSIRPTKDLMSNRYLSSQKYGATHIDLLDQLTFYGAFRRKFNLHMWCKAFGIDSPKEEGVTGDDVTALFNSGNIIDIARYNVRDIRSTAELYKRWDQYMRP